jgi:hypothetical protein
MVVQIVAFWVVMLLLSCRWTPTVSEEHSASNFSNDPEDGGSIFLKNTEMHLQDCTVSQPRKQQSELCPTQKTIPNLVPSDFVSVK